MLRDLGTIDLSEAAYLFHELFDDLLWKEMQSDVPDLALAVVQGVDPDLIFAAMHDQEIARMEAWYRERGEEGLADMVRDRAHDYDQLCAEGHFSVIDEKPSREAPAPQLEAAAEASRFAEQVLALLATESRSEALLAYEELSDAMRAIPPAVTVPAIRNLRDLGGISFEESTVLVDLAIEDEVNGLLAADREYCRLRRELDEVRRLHGISSYLREPRPLAWHLLEQRLARRMYGMTAVVLRRYGEHRLANMMLANPAEFERIRDTQLGAA